MKTITMSLKEYEDIMKAKKETLEAVNKNLVCIKTFGLGEAGFKWFDLGDKLKENKDEISNLKSENKRLQYESDEMRRQRDDLNGRYWEAVGHISNVNLIKKSHDLTIESIRNMTGKEFKLWKKRSTCEV